MHSEAMWNVHRNNCSSSESRLRARVVSLIWRYPWVSYWLRSAQPRWSWCIRGASWRMYVRRFGSRRTFLSRVRAMRNSFSHSWSRCSPSKATCAASNDKWKCSRRGVRKWNIGYRWSKAKGTNFKGTLISWLSSRFLRSKPTLKTWSSLNSCNRHSIREKMR